METLLLEEKSITVNTVVVLWLDRKVVIYRRGFFFQAEDGIRDYKVTGVQTCALPISAALSPPCLAASKSATLTLTNRTLGLLNAVFDAVRSEERRVGKECRSRWS